MWAGKLQALRYLSLCFDTWHRALCRFLFCRLLLLVRFESAQGVEFHSSSETRRWRFRWQNDYLLTCSIIFRPTIMVSCIPRCRCQNLEILAVSSVPHVA